MVDKYILVSLDEKKSKDLANVISNDTSRKILDYLGEHDKVAPVHLSKKLNIPISTVTYNLNHLKKQGLVETKDHAWSDKGKKVELYSIAKKLIVIAPKGFDWKDSLKKIIPIGLVGLVGTALLKAFQPMMKLTGTQEMFIMEEAAEDAAPAVADTAINTLSQGVYYPYWLFFLVFVCIIIVTIVYLDYRKSKK